MLDDILFGSSVLTFSASAILGYWQVLRAAAGNPEDPALRFSEPEPVPEALPSAI